MTIRRLSYAEKDAAVGLLSRAFFDYPVMRYVLKEAGDAYPEHLHALIGFFCETRLTRDWPLLGLQEKGVLAAVAGVNEPLDKPWPASLHEIYRHLGATIGKQALQRLEAFEQQSSLNEPQQPHYFLGILGVDPDHQGRGYARAMIDAIQALSDKDKISTGIALSTESRANLPLYAHLGFDVISQSRVGDLQTWCLYRANGRG